MLQKLLGELKGDLPKPFIEPAQYAHHDFIRNASVICLSNTARDAADGVTVTADGYGFADRVFKMG